MRVDSLYESCRHAHGRSLRGQLLLLAVVATVCALGFHFFGTATGIRTSASEIYPAPVGAASMSAYMRRMPPPSIGCTPAQRDAQAKAFTEANAQAGGKYRASSCPSIAILAALQAVDPSAGGMLDLVNVGANKGYGVAEVMALWRPDLGVTPKSVHADLKEAYPDANPRKILGVCWDGNEVVPEPATTAALPTLTVHAVEPLPVNVPLLQRLARSVLDARPSPRARMTVHPGAVGPDADAKLGYNPVSCAAVGGEACQMEPLREGLTAVTGWTLDSFFEEHSLFLQGPAGDHSAPGPVIALTPRPRRSIFLKIDAEGYDGAILINSKTGPGSALDAVRAVEFEYHRVGKWGLEVDQVRLEDVVTKLDGAGMDCYLEYADKLVHLTGTCWTSAYEFFSWSNVLCVRRGDVWADIASHLAEP